MPVTFIGDVHGWSDRLDRVLAQARGHLVFMGDLIDRGPDSPGVMNAVRKLCDSGAASCLMGNHEYALVRGLGVPELEIPENPDFYQGWVQRYGGDAVLAAYGLGDSDPHALRRRLGDGLAWMAQLPWLLEGGDAGGKWLAVHAGFGAAPLAPQVAELYRSAESMRTAPPEAHPAALYAKSRAFLVPQDLPANHVVVSGHTPQPSAVVTAQRILCDTSGGLPERSLSGVIWPEGWIITS